MCCGAKGANSDELDAGRAQMIRELGFISRISSIAVLGMEGWQLCALDTAVRTHQQRACERKAYGCEKLLPSTKFMDASFDVVRHITVH